MAERFKYNEMLLARSRWVFGTKLLIDFLLIMSLEATDKVHTCLSLTDQSLEIVF